MIYENFPNIKMSNFLFYSFSLILMMNFFHSLFFWFFMEVNLMCFILMSLSMEKNFYNSEKCFFLLYYFLIQCLASFLFLNSLFVENFFYSDFFGSLVVFMVLFFKLGLFPFHFWVFKFCELLNSLETFLVLIFQKIPFFFFLLFFDWVFLFLGILVSSLVSSIFLYNSKKILHIIIASSIYMTFWFFSFFLLNFNFFLSFLLIYIFNLYEFCKLKFMNFFDLSYSENSKNLIIISLFFMGLPPFSLFFYKFFSFNSILSSFSLFVFPLIFFFTFLSMMGYFKLFFKFFFISVNIFKSMNYKFLYYLSTMLFFFFLF